MDSENLQIVVFDLEATGLAEDDEIIQIAACTKDSSFDIYITPTRYVHPEAEKITGLQMHDGYLCLNKQRVSSKTPLYAFQQFLGYLTSLQKYIILVAHNCFRFDMPKIMKLAEQVGYLEEFKSLLYGFGDTLIMFRAVLEQRYNSGGSFSMKSLVQDYIGDVKNLHNATCDAEMLLRLINLIGLSDYYIIENTKVVGYRNVPLPFNGMTTFNVPASNMLKVIVSLEPKTYLQTSKLSPIATPFEPSEVPVETSEKPTSLLPSKKFSESKIPWDLLAEKDLMVFADVLSESMINKILDCGFDIATLNQVFYHCGWDGICEIFSADCADVTCDPSIITATCMVLKEHFLKCGVEIPAELLLEEQISESDLNLSSTLSPFAKPFVPIKVPAVMSEKLSSLLASKKSSESKIPWDLLAEKDLMVFADVLSESMIKKISDHSFDITTVNQIFYYGGWDGICELFSADNTGVTSDPCIITATCMVLKEHFVKCGVEIPAELLLEEQISESDLNLSSTLSPFAKPFVPTKVPAAMSEKLSSLLASKKSSESKIPWDLLAEKDFMVFADVLSESMIKKISDHSFDITTVNQIFYHGGWDGIRELFSADNTGVTSDPCIITATCMVLKEHFLKCSVEIPADLLLEEKIIESDLNLSSTLSPFAKPFVPTKVPAVMSEKLSSLLASKNSSDSKIAWDLLAEKDLMIFADVLSQSMINKIADHSFDITTVNQIFYYGGWDGIRELFSADNTGVTSDPSIITATCMVLKEHFLKCGVEMPAELLLEEKISESDLKPSTTLTSSTKLSPFATTFVPKVLAKTSEKMFSLLASEKSSQSKIPGVLLSEKEWMDVAQILSPSMINKTSDHSLNITTVNKTFYYSGRDGISEFCLAKHTDAASDPGINTTTCRGLREYYRKCGVNMPPSI